MKLFTSGCGLTPGARRRSARRGLFLFRSASTIGRPGCTTRGRGYPGAFDAAIEAIRLFREAGLDVGVSAVLSAEMIQGRLEANLEFIQGLGVHEAWLSEMKPSRLATDEPDGLIVAQSAASWPNP